MAVNCDNTTPRFWAEYHRTVLSQFTAVKYPTLMAVPPYYCVRYYDRITVRIRAVLYDLGDSGIG